MRILKTKHFDKFARKAKITDLLLKKAMTEIENGLIDANLGSGLIKQRIPKQGRGKSKGYRTIIIYKLATFSLFVAGFDKKDQENISDSDLEDLKAFADQIFLFTDEQIQRAIDAGKFIELTEENVDEI